MDGERSASENLAKRAFFRIRQNPASPKPRLRKYFLIYLCEASCHGSWPPLVGP